MNKLGLMTSVVAVVLTNPVCAGPQDRGRGNVTAVAPHISVAQPRFARPAAMAAPMHIVHPTIAARPRLNIQRTYATLTPSYRARPEVRAQVRAQRVMALRAAGTQTEQFPARSTRNWPMLSTTTGGNVAQQQTDPSRVGKNRDDRNRNDRNAYWGVAQRDHHEFHDRTWWHQHFPVIVFASAGYYYLDSGYWYPCWGYDPNSDYNDYDGPVYAYNNQVPNQVIADVQSALQQEGYYSGAISGSLDAQTRAAIATYQQDNGLEITGNVDEATVEALGLQ